MSVLLEHVPAVLMDEERTVLSDAYVAVKEGKITYVGRQRPAGTFREVIHGKGNVLMPGFVNCHTHVPMTLLRGYGGGCDLHTWLNEYIFPAEAKLDGRAVRCATQLALAELIAAGVTTFADMYYFCDDIIEATIEAGLSANIARGITDFGPENAFDFETYQPCVELRELADKWNGYDDGRIIVDACIHGEYTSHPALWQEMAWYAREKGLGMHVHISETRSEHDECLGRWGTTPLQTLANCGVFDVRAIAAHCVWVSPDDIALLKEKNITPVHNPVSNLKLGSGVAPVPLWLRSDINVALGTDGVSSNNSHDMFEEVKLAAMLRAGVSLNPQAVSPYEALKMATVNGGIALGRRTGKIEAGYDADLILVDFHKPNNIPCHDVIENLVYSCHGSDVVMNMARGRVIYKDGEYRTLDLERIRREVDSYAMPLIFGK